MRSRLAKVEREMPQEMPGVRQPSAEEIYQMIAEAAYYRAEKRGFAPGLEDEDWRAAEAEVRERVQQLQARI